MVQMWVSALLLCANSEPYVATQSLTASMFTCLSACLVVGDVSTLALFIFTNYTPPSRACGD